MSVDVSTEILIAKPIEIVGPFAADPDNVPRWYVNIKSVQWRTEPVTKVGAQIAFEAQFLGRHLAYVYEIVEFEPLAKLVMRTAEGPFPMETSCVWEVVSADSTRMTLRNRGQPTGFSKLLAPLMTTMMRRANRSDLALLKQVLERGDAEAASGITD